MLGPRQIHVAINKSHSFIEGTLQNFLNVYVIKKVFDLLQDFLDT